MRTCAFLCLMILLVVPSAGSAAESRWTIPPIEQPPAQLPRLAGPLVLDGELGEWESAASAPVWSRADLARVIPLPAHEWKGPADASMEISAAWNDHGLCFAAVVCDNELSNDRPDDLLWQRDCIELFVDGRAGEKFMKPPYSRGAYQLLIKPPLGGRPPAIVVNSRDGKIGGLRVAGKPTPTGYTAECVIPWAAFPGLVPKPGAQIGIQFALDDHDSRDRGMTQPRVLNYHATPSLFNSPQNLIRWVLVDAIRPGPDTTLAPRASLEVQKMILDGDRMPIAAELTSGLARTVHSVDVSVRDAAGAVVFSDVVKPKSLPAPWKQARSARTEWKLKSAGDGIYTATMAAHGKDGSVIGTLSRRVLVGREGSSMRPWPS